MAAATLARPLPTVIQPAVPQSRPSRVVSFSSASDTSPSSDSNIHSSSSGGDSCFYVPASHSSHSSTSSYPPLPKGARPASPQPTRLIELVAPSHPKASNREPPHPGRSGTSTSWKLEWRGVSKVVRWAVLGQKSESGPKPSRPSSRMTQHENYNAVNTHSEMPAYTRTPDQILPTEDSFSPYIYASPTYSLSPTTSATCVSTMHDGHYSKSGLGERESKGSQPESGVRFPSHELPRRNGSVQSPEHDTHVQEPKYTNVRRAASELGHGHPYGTSFDMEDTFSNIHHSTTSIDSSDNWPRHPCIVRSDIGHSRYVESMPFSGSPSTFSLSYGRDNAYVKPGANVRTFNNFRSMQSAIALPVSTAKTSTPSDLYRRPRKLRKSLRAMPAQDKRASLLNLNRPPTSAQPKHYEVSSRRETSLTSISPSPLPPSKSQLRQPRKLKKRPSPALPPLPSTSSGDASGNPPPVPPKLSYDTESKNVATAAPVSECHSSGISADSPPALTNTSASISPDDELPSQESSATSEILSHEGRAAPPVKRPSLLRTESNRRWTVAVAEVPDDLFIEELERLRRMGLRAGDIHGVRNVSQGGHSISSSASESRDEQANCHLYDQTDIVHPGNGKVPNAVLIQEVDIEDEMDWLQARRAILCCRELVRTERSYQERLQELAEGHVSDAVPASLIRFLPTVIGASKILSAHFNEDMSASGVARAFLSVSPILVRALVAWSGVVGEFFSGRATALNNVKRKRDVTFTGFIAEEETYTEFGAVKVRCMSMHGPYKAYVARSSSARVVSGGALSTSSSAHWLFRPAFAQVAPEASEKETVSVLRKSSSRRTDLERARRRKPPFRDLAILPTQRVTRYILLYKDLLKHTPSSSPVRELVEKAVEVAINLADRCNRAQDNATFVFHR